MSIEETIRLAVAEAVRETLRTELAALRDVGSMSPIGDTAPRYLTTDDAATLAGVKPDTIRDWVKAGRLTEHRAGRLLRVRADELEAYLARGTRELGPSEAELEKRAAAIVANRRRRVVE